MSLMRWDPFSEMTSLRQAITNLFENSFIRPGVAQGARAGGLGFELGIPVDVFERGDTLVVTASLPGMKADDVTVSIQNNVLTITGEQREEQVSDTVRYHYRERRTGSFGRAIALPVEVDADACDARFADGVLTLTLPKAEQARTKHISIHGQQQQLGAGGTGNGQRAEPATAGRA